MKIFEVTSRMPDGTEILEFTNGYTFEGTTDAKDYPVSGILKTPKGRNIIFHSLRKTHMRYLPLLKKENLRDTKLTHKTYQKGNGKKNTKNDEKR